MLNIYFKKILEYKYAQMLQFFFAKNYFKKIINIYYFVSGDEAESICITDRKTIINSVLNSFLKFSLYA